MTHDPFVAGPAPPRSLALLTDLYELTMIAAYRALSMEEEAVFSLFARRLPPRRNLLLACGLADALRYLETLRFSGDDVAFLDGLGLFDDDFLAWMEGFRFTGDVHAVPEGTPVFADEPLLEVVAPLPEAQLVESHVMNQVHLQTVLASKAYRVVTAARGRRVVDFGMRRMHGVDAALKAARAFHIAGVDATSNVLAGRLYGVPVAGTMAHSFVQAHDREADAFRGFAGVHPDSILLVDTYDTIEGTRRVVRLAEELGEDFQVRGVRLDSGSLGDLAHRCRAILDEAGLRHVEIFASGGLDEDEIARLVDQEAPITGFGVGTHMGVSSDAPALDMAYKLTAYAGRGRMKLSTGKRTLPGRKQVYRLERDGVATGDVIALADEDPPGRPLLRRVMESGRSLPDAARTISQIRAHAAEEVALLPEAVRANHPPPVAYPVTATPALAAYAERVAGEVGR